MKIDDLDTADDFIVAQRALGNLCWWDGWKMVFFHHSYVKKDHSVMYRGQHGFLTKIDIDDYGTWNVPARVIV